MLGRADVEIFARKVADLVLQSRDGLRESAGQVRQRRPLHLDAGALHGGEHRLQRPLQRLVDRRHLLRRQARLQEHPQPKGDIRFLPGGFGGARHLDEVKRDRRLAGTEHFFFRERGMAEPRGGKLCGRMVGAARIKRIRDEAGIVHGLKRDAIAGERHHVGLGARHDLQHGLIFEDRLQQVERFAQGCLRPHVFAAEIEPVARAMA